MPNWCSNDLYLVGPEADVTACAEFIKSDKRVIDFDKIVPYPARFREMDRICEEWQNNNPGGNWVNCPKDGYNGGGYDWCVSHWGTKWNSDRADEPTVRPHSDKPGYVVWHARFDTAWTPPTPVIAALSSKYRTVLMVLKYYECGCGFKGDFRVRHGRVIKDTTDVYSGRRGG